MGALNVTMPKQLSHDIEVPAAQDHFAGEIFEHITSEYGACAAVEAVFNYYSNVGEYALQEDMDPRTFVQFIVDSRILAEDFTMFDAEDITRKLVEDGYTRFPLPAFYIGLAKIAFYKYRLAPQDSAETLIDDHILRIEGEAVAFMLHHGPRLAQTPHPHDLRADMDPRERMNRVYLFYTEPGKPMFFEDFKLFCADFEICPDSIPIEQAAQIFHSNPARQLSLDDFAGPILHQLVACISGAKGSNNEIPVGLSSGYGRHGEDAMVQWLDHIKGHSAMEASMHWYDEVYGNNAPHRRVDKDHVGVLREDPTRKDQPVRPAKEYTEHVEHEKYRFKKADHSKSLVIGPGHLMREQSTNPFLSELKERQRAIQLAEPMSASLSHNHTLRAPAPYSREPSARDAKYASQLLDSLSRAHRVDIQLLFDIYGDRDGDHGRGIITGDDLHQMVWDAGLIGQGHRLGVTKSVNAYFEKCVGNAFRDNVRISFDRFRIMLVRTAEWMASLRDYSTPQAAIDFAMTDLVRDYLGPLAHAKFWKEYYGQSHLARQ